MLIPHTTMRYYLVICFANILLLNVSGQNATEIVKKADEKARGEKSSITTMTMQIVRPSWTRSVSFKSWNKGTDLSVALITAPAKDKGQAFLKRKTEMWNWNPSINRMIKFPPSMLSQGWMGSDFTNDDLLNQSSIIVDFTHKILTTETISGKECYKIELLPKENAQVVWGRIVLWISKDDFLQLKSEYFDEDLEPVKTETASEIKNISGRLIPTRFELIPGDKPGNKTIVTLESAVFNSDIPDSFFTQQNMKNLK
jgi:outer membrane lipoprotein-sorting protein